MPNLTRKALPLLFILSLSCSGCGVAGIGANGGCGETGGNTWLSADATPFELTVATPRTTGAADWRDEIIYFIMTDRFADGDRGNNGPFYDKSNLHYYHGGDLQGIMDHLDYLRHLGITTVWITPVVENVWRDPNYSSYTGYHGYWARDFTKLDPHLGSDTAFYQKFVNTLHDQGILVIQDIVVNHLGPLAAYSAGWAPAYSASGYTRAFAQTLNPNLAASYNYTIPTEAPFGDRNAFHSFGKISNYDDPSQCLKGDLSDLPDLATETAAVRAELTAAYGTWAGYGVDGFRIDTVKHVEPDFWDDFCPQIRNKAGRKNFLQFGEVLIGYHPALAGYLNSPTGLDSVLNYDLYYVMRAVFGTDGAATNQLTAELARRANSYRRDAIDDGGDISAQNGLVNFIDNHDNNRFLTDAGGNCDRLWLALTYLLTTKGIPSLYYNTENNITGTSDSGRQKMPDFKTTGKKTFTLIRALAKIRKDRIALRRGEINVLQDAAAAGIFAFVRFTGIADDNVFILLNTSGRTISATVPIGNYAANGTVLTNILAAEFGRTETVPVVNDAITASLPAYGMKIFK